MAMGEAAGYVSNIHHPEIMRGVLEQIRITGDVIGPDARGWTILAVAVEN
jgi:hypothetical protein